MMSQTSKSMLVFHTAYTFDQLTERGLEVFIYARNLGGFFDRVFTINALASLQYFDPSKVSNLPNKFNLDSQNIILEGAASSLSVLKKFPKIDFLWQQFKLFRFLLLRVPWRDIVLVRAEDPRFNGLYGLIAAKILRKPFVVGVWGNPHRLRLKNGRPNMPRLFKKTSTEEKLEKFVLKRADLVLAQNEENRSYVTSIGIAIDRTKLMPLEIGIHPSHFLPTTERISLPEHDSILQSSTGLVIGCISRLESEKNVDHAIRAVMLLKKEKIDFTLVLVGEGSKRQELKKLAKDCNLEQEVVFAGAKSQIWISRFLKDVDIIIAPLCGRSLLETSLAGCPTVAYDVDWHSDIILDGITGTLVKDLDHAVLGEAVLELSKNSELRAHYSHNLRSKAIDRASPQKIAENLNAIYESLVGRQ